MTRAEPDDQKWEGSAKGPDDNDRLMTVEEVAELLCLARGTIYHMISEHKIETVHLSSRCVRFRPSAVQAWIESCTRRATDSEHKQTPNSSAVMRKAIKNRQPERVQKRRTQ